MRWPWLAIGALIPLSAAWPSTEISAKSDGGDGHALVRKALDRAAWNEEQDFASRSRSRMTKNVRRFDKHGEVTEEDDGDYEVVPIDRVPFERRLTIHDRPLSDEERGWEDEREMEFREALRRSRESGDEPEREEEIVFNEELLARYTFTLEGEAQLRGRASYRVSFQPRAGHLPAPRAIDHALNKARGTIWIDRETYEAARIEFELTDKVRLWWGLLGTIRRARGSLDRGPVLDEAWATIQYETYTDTRVIFKSTRRAEYRQWRDFEWVEAP